jgi:hypothetical protein
MLEGRFRPPTRLQELATPTLLWLLLLTLAVVAFSSGTEVAMLAANRYRARAQAATGSRRAKLLLSILSKPDDWPAPAPPPSPPSSPSATGIRTRCSCRRCCCRH